MSSFSWVGLRHVPALDTGLWRGVHRRSWVYFRGHGDSQPALPELIPQFSVPKGKLQTDCCFVFSAISYCQAIPRLKISSGSFFPAALSLNSYDNMSRPFIISLFPTQASCLLWVSILTSPSNSHMPSAGMCPLRCSTSSTSSVRLTHHWNPQLAFPRFL